jgi:hypothetical protein
MWVLWNLVLVRLEMELMSMQDSVMVCTKRTIGLEIILDTPDGTPRLQGSTGCSFRSVLEIVLILTQDWCTVCTQHTICSKIILNTPDGTPT